MSWVTVGIAAVSAVSGYMDADKKEKAAKKASKTPQTEEGLSQKHPWEPAAHPLSQLIGAAGNQYYQAQGRYNTNIPGLPDYLQPGAGGALGPGFSPTPSAPAEADASDPYGGKTSAGDRARIEANMRKRGFDLQGGSWKKVSDGPLPSPTSSDSVAGAPSGPAVPRGTSDPREIMRMLTSGVNSPDAEAMRSYASRVTDPDYGGNAIQQSLGKRLTDRDYGPGYDAMRSLAAERSWESAPPSFYADRVPTYGLLDAYRASAPRSELLASRPPTHSYRYKKKT
jgi:hypothetical protein